MTDSQTPQFAVVSYTLNEVSDILEMAILPLRGLMNRSSKLYNMISADSDFGLFHCQHCGDLWEDQNNMMQAKQMKATDRVRRSVFYVETPPKVGIQKIDDDIQNMINSASADLLIQS